MGSHFAVGQFMARRSVRVIKTPPSEFLHLSVGFSHYWLLTGRKIAFFQF